MNYNLLWYLWFIWSFALVIYLLGWSLTLTLVRQYRGLLLALGLALIAGAAFRGVQFNKGITMFKRKENSLHSGYGETANAAAARPPEEDFEESVSVATVVKTTVDTTTTIPETCTITGEIDAEGDVHINGCVTGKINARKTVFVQKHGRVDGEIYAQRIEISGELKGLGRSREVAVNAEGFMDGTVECESLAVHHQGRFYGSSKPWQEEKTDQVKIPGQEFQLHKALLPQ
ncbi:polymer-forming cytoskeletal protein [Pantoea sp. KPR_PJ]|uniref:bactofilin family protein n=1 Tax=Pantoea sp. KPR_PJ TaxID=2738375 RepID=UPI0035289D69